MTANSPEKTSQSDPFDELAGIYLTSSDADAPAQAVKEPAFREVLIVGNLPVRGGVWLTPYADAIARRNGPTALVRLDLEPPTLELFGVTEQPRANGTSDQLQFRDAVLDAAAKVAVWIVRGPAELAPADMARFDVDRLTILSSADKAAAVAAYQIIKDIARAAEKRGIENPPAIALAIAGARDAKAVDLVRRINETTSSKLGIEVALAHSLSKIDSGIRCRTYAFFAEDKPPTVSDLLEWIDEAEHAASWGLPADADDESDELWEEEDSSPPLRLAPMVSVHDRERDSERIALLDDDDGDEVATVSHELPREPEIKTIPRSPAAPEPPQRGPAAPGVKLPPTPAAEVDRPAHASPRTASPALSQFAEGLVALAARCPMHPEIELSTDEAGNIHVLAREDGLRAMRIVETWARTHRELLAMACAADGVSVRGEVICHAFTDQPANLADLHGTNLRLHILAPVKVGGETAWYCAPLNR